MAKDTAAPATSARVRSRLKLPNIQLTLRQRQIVIPYLFIAPFLLVFVTMSIGPDIYAFFLSLERYRGYGTATFIGLQNYVNLLQYHVFWTETFNTLFYWLAHTVPLIVIAFLLALLVRSKFLKGKAFFQSAIFIPNIVVVVASSLIFRSLFSTSSGVVNSLFHAHVPWLDNPTLAHLVVVLLLIWRNLGFWFVVFLAGLTSINPELEEAATVDGASALQRLRFITLPLMRNIVFFAFIIDAINSMRLYTEPNVLTSVPGQVPDPNVSPLLELLVSNLNNGFFGESAAVGWLLFLLTTVVALVIFGLFRLGGEVD